MQLSWYYALFRFGLLGCSLELTCRTDEIEYTATALDITVTVQEHALMGNVLRTIRKHVEEASQLMGGVDVATAFRWSSSSAVANQSTNFFISSRNAILPF